MRYLYIHGLGQNASAWKGVLASMEEGTPAACPDLMELPYGREPTYPELYRAFSQYCGQFEEPLGLCGLSLGGILALHYAVEHPQRVGALALISAQYKMPRLLLKLQNMVFRLMRESAFQEMGFGKADLIRLTSSMGTLDFSQSLKNVSCKALVLCGERDKANRKAAEQLAAGLPYAELRLVPGAGHEVNLDAPQVLAAILDQYFERMRS